MADEKQPEQREDASGRVLYPWEVSPEDAVRPVVVEESEEAKKQRELLAEQGEQVALAAPTGEPKPVPVPPRQRVENRDGDKADKADEN